MNPSSTNRRNWFGVVILLAVWVVIGIAISQRVAIFDWWRLRGYAAPNEIAQLAEATTMNDDTRNLFYVYHPDIEAREAFNDHCRESGEFTIILGCYVSNGGIYLFRIDDPRLQGVLEVTAAHETLHAAYDRLSRKEREQVDTWTSEALQLVTNQRIKDTVEEYRKNDPSSVPNELHSILGTEVRDLPAPLENYYKRYFNDRSKIVAYSEAYESAFTSRKAQADAYAAQLKQLKAQIDAANSRLESQSQQLKEEYEQLNGARGQMDPAQFNAQATAFNAKVQSYNQEVERTRALISRYNNIYEQYKQVVLEQQNLYKSIDSRPQTLQAQ